MNIIIIVSFIADAKILYPQQELTIRLPESIKQINQIKTEIDRVYNKQLETETSKDCMSMRNLLKNAREELLINLGKLTESAHKQ